MQKAIGPIGLRGDRETARVSLSPYTLYIHTLAVTYFFPFVLAKGVQGSLVL